MARRYFWNDGEPEYGTSRTRMYVEDGQVALEAEYWDSEDQRRYDYSIRFPVFAYRRVWRELRQGKGGVVAGENGGRLSFSRQGERVEMNLSSTPFPASTPGGSMLGGSAGLGAQFDQMALTADELVGPDEPIANVFNTLKSLVAAGKVEVQEVRSVTANLDPKQLNELIKLFQEMEVLRETAGQAEANQEMIGRIRAMIVLLPQ